MVRLMNYRKYRRAKADIKEERHIREREARNRYDRLHADDNVVNIKKREKAIKKRAKAEEKAAIKRAKKRYSSKPKKTTTRKRTSRRSESTRKKDSFWWD